MSQTVLERVGQVSRTSENLKAFVEKASHDSALKERIQFSKDSNDIAVIAQESGFDISASDIAKLTSFSVVEITEEELETIRGKKMRRRVCILTCIKNSSAVA